MTCRYVGGEATLPQGPAAAATGGLVAAAGEPDAILVAGPHAVSATAARQRSIVRTVSSLGWVGSQSSLHPIPRGIHHFRANTTTS